MPLLRRKRVLAAKIETTPGTPISLSASDAVFNVFDSQITPAIEFTPREGQSSFSPLHGTLGAYGGTVTFSHELAPGSGALPAWAATFLPACGWVATGSVYTPRTEAPGTNVKTLTIGMYQDGVFKSIRGAMGTFVIRCESGKPVMLDFTFTGLWVAPSDVAIIAPTYPTLKPLRFVSAGVLIGAWAPKIATLTIDAGNEVILREDANDAAGYSTALATGRRMTGSLTPESELIATKDYHGEWLSMVEQALAVVLSSGGIGWSIAAPKLQFTNVSESERNQVQIDTLEFQLNRSAAAGDDEMSLTADSTP